MSMEERSGFIWMDGALVPWRDARLHVLAHTLHHGMGVFEGVRAYPTAEGPSIFRLRDHTARLFRSAHILQIKIPFTPEQICEAHLALVDANQLDACYFRPIVFFGGQRVGVSAKGNRVHVAIAAWLWGDYLGAEANERGIRVKTSSYARLAPNSVHGHAKACGYYINSMLANHEAVHQGYDEALLLDQLGFVAEGATENIFIVQGGQLSTPHRSSVLEGITRDSIMHLANDLGLKVIERAIARDEVYVADEAFFTGTAAEIVPIRELDGRAIGTGNPGSITRQLQQAYFDVVTGRNLRYAHWLECGNPERSGEPHDGDGL